MSVAPHPKEQEAITRNLDEEHHDDQHTLCPQSHYIRDAFDPLRVKDQPFLPVYHRRIADPAPLGFMALGSGLFVLSIVAMGADGLSSLSASVAVILTYCAIAELVAGIWEFPTGNTFGASLFMSLSGLFASTAFVLAPWSGIASSYTSATEFSAAVGINFFSWFIVLVLFTIAAHRSSGGLVVCLTLVDFTLLFFGLYYYYATKPHLLTAAGSFGIVASFVAYYAALSSILTDESSSFRLPVLLDLSKLSFHKKDVAVAA
jgi:succinate-acetate transporter protein